MRKPTKDDVLVESYRISENGAWVRDDQRMTKKQLENYAAEIESEERIERARQEASRPRNDEPGGGLSGTTRSKK